MDADGVMQYPRAGWLKEMARLGGVGFIAEVFREELTTLTGKADLRELLVEMLRRRGRDCTAEEVLEVWYRIDVDDFMLGLVDRVRAAGLTTVLATNQQSYRGSFMQANVRGAEAAGLNAVHFSLSDTYGHLRFRLQALGVPGL